MAQASDYPITTGYGQVPGYPLNGGFHNGVDRAMPNGTPVIVNGVTIGLSNNTGASTGPHLHMGRYVNGSPTNPGGGGFTFNSAVVHSTGQDNMNGKFIRITGDGAIWNYLHLQSIAVAQGQVLKKEEPMPNEGDVHNAYLTANDRKATAEEVKVYTSKPWSAVDGLYYGKILVDMKQFKNSSPSDYQPVTEQLYKKG